VTTTAEATRAGAPAKRIPHGTLSGYQYHRCRCAQCREAKRAYESNYRRQQAYGTWQPLTDATPVRDHVRALMRAGIGWQRVAHLAGVQAAVIERILYEVSGRPTTRRVRHEHAAKILAVQPCRAHYSPGRLVDVTGSRRRIHALAAVGWPARYIAARYGLNANRISAITNQKYVQLHTAQDIARIYEEIRGVDPEQEGVPPVAVLRSRQRAERAGWPRPDQWDGDIDDPAADPNATAPKERADRGPEQHTRAELLARARVLHDQGLQPAQIAARIRMSERTVLRWQAAWKQAA